MSKKVSKTFKIMILIIFYNISYSNNGIWRMLKELKTLLQKYFGTSSPKPTKVKKPIPRKGRDASRQAKFFSLGDW